jgi:hypothetical protein
VGLRNGIATPATVRASIPEFRARVRVRSITNRSGTMRLLTGHLWPSYRSDSPSPDPKKVDRSLGSEFHGIRIPLHHGATLDAEVAEQGGSGGSVAEDGIFHHRLA